MSPLGKLLSIMDQVINSDSAQDKVEVLIRELCEQKTHQDPNPGIQCYYLQWKIDTLACHYERSQSKADV